MQIISGKRSAWVDHMNALIVVEILKLLTVFLTRHFCIEVYSHEFGSFHMLNFCDGRY